jgi:hypothetical protein
MCFLNNWLSDICFAPTELNNFAKLVSTNIWLLRSQLFFIQPKLQFMALSAAFDLIT